MIQGTPDFRPANEMASQQNELHPTLESAMGQRLQAISLAETMHKRVEASRREINNNVHWGPFQRAEQEYHERFTKKFVGPNGPPEHFHATNPVLANIALWQALQNPNNVELRTKVREFKQEFCDHINKQWKDQDIQWRAGPGLDNQTNFDAQKGTEYMDIRKDQKVLTDIMQKYDEDFAEFVRTASRNRGRPPSMAAILRFKIDWCRRKNAELDEKEEKDREQGREPTIGRVYEANAWSGTIAWAPRGDVHLPRTAPAPAPRNRDPQQPPAPAAPTREPAPSPSPAPPNREPVRRPAPAPVPSDPLPSPRPAPAPAPTPIPVLQNPIAEPRRENPTDRIRTAADGLTDGARAAASFVQSWVNRAITPQIRDAGFDSEPFQKALEALNPAERRQLVTCLSALSAIVSDERSPTAPRIMDVSPVFIRADAFTLTIDGQRFVIENVGPAPTRG